MTDRSDLIETIANLDNLSTFSRLMKTSGANAAFSAGGDFTVFAPTNDAFCKIPDSQMNALLQEPRQTTLKSLLSYHILAGKFTAEELGPRVSAQTITDLHVKFTDSRAGLIVNDSGVQTINIEAANGIVHELDTVLIYDTERFATGPLNGPKAERMAEAELFVQRWSVGSVVEAADGQVNNGIGRSDRSFGSGRRSSSIF